MTYKIPLTQGKFALVDKEDVLFLCQWTWYYKDGYAVRKKNGQRIYMHRVILERMGFNDFEESDHINRNRLDNRREYLRTATRAQNSYNRNKQKNNTSGYIGVYRHKKNKNWTAQIVVNGKNIYLGSFDNEIMAARMYDIFAIKYHGEFASLNFPKAQ